MSVFILVCRVRTIRWRDGIMPGALFLKFWLNEWRIHYFTADTFVFEKVNKDEDIKFWRCESFNKVDIKCKAQLHTNLNNDILQELNFHICDTNAASIEVQKIMTGIKRRANVTMEAPAQIMARAMENVATPVLAQIPTKKATNLVLSFLLYFLLFPLSGSSTT